MNISTLFYKQSRQQPKAPALWIQGEVYTYERLHEMASSLASAMDAHASKHVAILAHRSLSAYTGLIGALYSGRAYLPLNPRFPEHRNLGMVETTNPKCVIVDERCEALAKGLLAKMSPKVVLMPEHAAIPDWCRELPNHTFMSAKELKSADYTPKPVEDRDLAYTLFTSGSTGTPKGVMVTHGNVSSFIDNTNHILQLRTSDRCTQFFDLTFDVSVHDLWITWAAGASLYVVPENVVLFGARFVQENEITVWYSVPSTGAILRHHKFLKENSLPSLRYSLFIGEALPTELAISWQKAAPNSALYNLYGPTEATVSITAYRFQPGEAYGTACVPIGHLYQNHLAKVVDADLKEVKHGEKGELCVSGPQVALGYWQQDALTAEKFVRLPEAPDRIWYRTGDLVCETAEFGWEFYGRVDRQVKIRGFRVELSEIENSVRKISGVDLVGVVGLRSERNSNFDGTVAFVCGTKMKSEEILQGCRQVLPDYMVPQEIRHIDHMPMNANGKTDYRQLEELLKNSGTEK